MTNAGEDAMSRLDAQIRNCSRKKPLTEEQAITIVIQQGYPVSPYGCLQCGHWHVGTDKRAEKPYYNIDYRLRDPFVHQKAYLDRQRNRTTPEGKAFILAEAAHNRELEALPS